MIIAGLVLLGLIGLGWWWRRRRAAQAVTPGPLAGIDTGVRSPFRVPGSSFFGPRRGF